MVSELCKEDSRGVIRRTEREDAVFVEARDLQRIWTFGYIEYGGRRERGAKAPPLK